MHNMDVLLKRCAEHNNRIEKHKKALDRITVIRDRYQEEIDWKNKESAGAAQEE
jgi:hypothetical protein